MATPKIATFSINLRGNSTDDVQVRIETRVEDARVSKLRALVIGVPCFLESQLAFLPGDLKELVIGTVASIVEAEKQLVGIPVGIESSSANGYLPWIADYTVELFNAPRGPAAWVKSKCRTGFDKNAAMSLTLINIVRQSTKLDSKDEIVRLLFLLDIGARYWLQKKPGRTSWLAGGSIYNRTFWTEYPKIVNETAWEKYLDLIPSSFDEFLYM